MQPIALVSTEGMSRDEWLQWRRKGIGGSDVSAIAGINQYKSPMAVYLDKVGLIEPDEAGEAAYWGTQLEGVVAGEFAKRTGLEVRSSGVMLQHPEHPWMLANIDREVVDEGVIVFLECKTASAFLADDWEGDKIPDAYMLQVQHYMAVTGAPFCYIAVLIGGQQFRHKRVNRDDELIAYIIEIERTFWNLVETQTPPPMDGSEASAELLDRMYPKGEASEINLPDEAGFLIQQYQDAKEAVKAAEAQADEASNKLKDMLKTASVGRFGSMKVAWGNSTRTTLDGEALQVEHPDIYDKFTKTTESRRFQIRQVKGGK